MMNPKVLTAIGALLALSAMVLGIVGVATSWSAIGVSPVWVILLVLAAVLVGQAAPHQRRRHAER